MPHLPGGGLLWGGGSRGLCGFAAARLDLSSWNPEVLGAGCSSVCQELSPTRWGGMAASPPPRSSQGFCFVCETHTDAEDMVLSQWGGRGRKGQCKVDDGTLPTHSIVPCRGRQKLASAAPQPPVGFVFPSSSFSFRNMKGQSLAGVFHCGFGCRRPPHPVPGRAPFSTRPSAGGCAGCSRSRLL